MSYYSIDTAILILEQMFGFSPLLGAKTQTPTGVSGRRRRPETPANFHNENCWYRQRPQGSYDTMTELLTSTLRLPPFALKEWAVVVQALAAGDSILLLRKGGIREAGGQFTVPQRQVWLYPTYEHQKPEGLKPQYRDRVMPVPSGWHPETVPIQAWAEITDVFSVQEVAVLASLSPFHCWQPDFMLERFQWKPRQPLSVLLLRVHCLPTVRSLPYQSEYGGCKSWIEFNPVDLADLPSSPVLSDADYQQRSQELVCLLS